MIKKICHMTSVHSWNDTRIYLKECRSLALAGYEVWLVAEGKDQNVNGINIVGCGDKPTSRRERMRYFAKKVCDKAFALDCDIYHFHDPELIPYALKLKKCGKKVIFDIHEDVSGQILSKDYIPLPLRYIISKLYSYYELYAIKKMDAVITATPHIASLFYTTNSVVEVINNYPLFDDIIFQDKEFSERERNICYTGSINDIRGEKIMIDAMKGIKDISLILAGPRDESSVGYDCDNVNYTGKYTRAEVNEIYKKCRAGLIIFQPEPNHINAKPNKMFEYMASGLPIVCSDFQLWREIVEGNGCGICVDPTNPQEVREACTYLVNNPDVAQAMGRRGYDVVKNKFNWNNEEKKLLDLYNRILSNGSVSL
ncbi:glycosyltransferase family 4 protein [Anaerovibrio lipolyticus]|uniref:glycosyltransferase family 4 protein n=1 Tax=Anaerovibrio lipolyticus TaxID=82374 RepID=UPI000687B787|nr:glycosyltransferase family 4 protein [Anaerovibrio lipolyticus]